MPLQNRVPPTGEIVVQQERGLFTGNRGNLLDRAGQMGVSRWRHKAWIICTLTHPKGRYHGPQPAHAWTPLFFLDEAVALAAGHRPCHYCRREAARSYRAAFERAHARTAKLPDIDSHLHGERVARNRQQIRHQAQAEDLPDGTFVLEDTPLLLWEGRALPYRPGGYAPPIKPPRGKVTILTPKSSVAALKQGYRPILHPSAATN